MTFRVFLFSIIIFSAFFFSANTTFAANRFWVGTAGANTNVTSSWSASSGGASGASVPDYLDTAIFDGAGAFNTDATINATWTVLSISITTGYSATITQAAGITVTVGTSGSYSQANGTYTATTGTFDDNGTFALSGGTFTPPTTVNTYAKDFTISGTGNYNIGVGATTTFDGALNQILDANGTLGGMVMITKSAVVSQTFTIATSTSISMGGNSTTTLNHITIINNGTITVPSGFWVLYNSESGSANASALTNNGTINHNGTGWNFTVNSGYYFNFINNASGVVNYPSASGTWTVNGTITNSGTITYGGSGGWNFSRSSLVNNAGGVITYASSSIYFARDFTQNGTFDLTGKTITFNGNDVSQTVTAVNAPLGGTVVITKIGANNQTFTIATSTSIDLGTNATTSVIFNNIINNGTITVSGTWTLLNNQSGSAIASTLTNNGTINHNGTGWIFTSNSSGYYFNFINNAGATTNFASVSGTLTVRGSITNYGTINYGTSTVISLTTNLDSSGTITGGATTTFSASGNSLINTNGVLPGIVVINKTGSGLTTIATTTILNLGVSPIAPTTVTGCCSVMNLTNNGTILVSGVWTVNGYYSAIINNGTITHSGTGWNLNYVTFTNNGTIDYAGSSWVFTTSSLINNTGASINYSGDLTIGVNLTQNGTFDMTNVTLTLSGGNNQIITTLGYSGGLTVINKTYGNLTLATTTVINLGDTPTSTLTTANSNSIFTNNGTINVGTGVWTVKGAAAYLTDFRNNGTINHSGSDWNMTNYTYFTNNPGAVVNSSSTAISIGGNFTQNGTFNLTGKTITFNGTLAQTVTADGELGGTVVINKGSGVGGNFTVASSTEINLGSSPTTTMLVSTFTNNGTITIDSDTWTLKTGTGGSSGSTLVNNGVINHNGNGLVFTTSGGQAFSLTNNGTFTYASTTISINGNLTQNGIFDLTGKTVTFNGNNAGTQIVTANGELGGTVIINKSGGGNFTIAAGTSINLGNNPTTTMSASTVTNNGIITIPPGGGTWTLSVNGGGSASSFVNNGTTTHNGSGWAFTGAIGFNFTNSAGATVTYASTTLSTTGSFTQNGTFNLTGKTLTFSGATNVTASTTGTFGGSIILNKTAANTLTLGSNMTVQDFTLTSGTLANVAKTLTINGNLIVTPAAQTYFGGALLSVVMAGSGDQNVTITSGTVVPPLNINKTAGKVSLLTNYTSSGASSVITVATGALYLNGKNLSATTTINNGGELQIQGNENFTTPTLNTGSTFTYVGNGDGLSNKYYIRDLAYSNLRINSTDIEDIFDANTPVGYGLAGYWKFDNDTDVTAFDQTGSNNGTYTNGAVSSSTAGKFGKGVNLDGVDDYVQINNSTLLNGATELTMSAWVNVRQFGSADGIFCTRGTRVHCLSSGAGTFWSYIDNTGAGSVITYNTGDWYFITGRWLGLKSQIFVNGQKIADSSNLLTTSLSVDDYWKIGWDDFQTIRYTDGYVDEVRIYGRTLSDSEILDLYNYNGIDNTYLNLNGSLTVSNGTLVASTTNLIMSGTNQTITLANTTTFASLTAGSTTASTTLNFGTTGSLVITGTTTLQGTSTMPLTLRSTVTGDQWHFQPDGARVFGYLDVQDSYNHSTDINAMSYTSITNSGNNTGWTFSNPTLTIGRSGTQISTTTAIINNQNLGGAFTLTPDGGDFTLSALKLHQAGSFPIEDISDIRIYSEATTTCSATKPSYLSDYATTTTFDANKVATTTFPNITLPTGTTTCLYITYDLSGTAGTSTMGRTIDLEISNPSLDVTAITGSITPTRPINISGTTMIPADNEVIVPAFPTLATTTNPNCSSNEITSLLSLTMPREAKNPTLYYLQNCAVYKQVGTTTARRLTTPDIQVHDLSFEKMSGGNVRISITASNMDPGQENTFMNVTRTLSTSATVRVWRGN